MLNFGYLNPATCFYYDVDNNLIVMFWRLQVLRAFSLFPGQGNLMVKDVITNYAKDPAVFE